MMLLLQDPYRLSSSINKDIEQNGPNYTFCPANKDNMRNTFVINYPRDFYYKFDNAGNLLSEYDGFLLNRGKSFKNRISVDIDIEYIFFCEEDLIMEIIPPHSHKVTSSSYGVIASGQFNIGKWFRPVTFNHFLWENETEFIAKENDPAMYVRFNTEEKVELKYFELNDPLLNSMRACIFYKDYYKPGKQILSLQERYLKFQNSKIRKHIIKNIKSNLVYN